MLSQHHLLTYLLEVLHSPGSLCLRDVLHLGLRSDWSREIQLEKLGLAAQSTLWAVHEYLGKLLRLPLKSHGKHSGFTTGGTPA